MCSISYNLSGVIAGQNVAATPSVTYTYDSAGNRTQMEERDAANALLGKSTYHYNNLGRMDWEQRTCTTSPGTILGTVSVSYVYDKAGLTLEGT